MYKGVFITYYYTSTQPNLYIKISYLEYSPMVVALLVLFRVQIGEDRDPFHTSLRENNENVLAHLSEESWG